jgi:hypothetical protein
MKKLLPRRPSGEKKSAVTDFAGLAKAVVERADVLTKSYGATRAYIAVMAAIGLAFLHAIATSRWLVPLLIALYLPDYSLVQRLGALVKTWMT